MALQIAPLIVPERRILIYLYLFVTGVILFHSLPALWHHGDQLVLLLSGGAFMILAAILLALYARHRSNNRRATLSLQERQTNLYY